MTAHSQINVYICVFTFPYCFLQHDEADTPVHILSLVFVDIDFQSGQTAALSMRHVKVVQMPSCLAEGHVCSKATSLALELSVMKTCEAWRRIESIGHSEIMGA